MSEKTVNEPPPVPEPPPPAPVSSLTAAAESVLRQPERIFHHLREANAWKLAFFLILVAGVCGLLYGFVMGTFSGGVQLWASPLKVSTGLMISALICLPSLYIFACLAGCEARLKEVVGLVSGLLALMTILLIGFAPVAWVFSQSTESVVAMGTLHLIFWAVAVGFGMRFLQRGFGSFHARGNVFPIWILLFLLVMLQMSTALRPLVGTSPHLLPTEKKFFLVHWFESMRDGEGRQSYSVLEDSVGAHQH